MTLYQVQPGQGTSLRELRQQVGDYFGRVRSTATGGSATTVVDTVQTYEADFWNGAYVLIDQADGEAPEGAVGRITDYSAGGTITCTNLGAAVAAGDTYEVYRRISPTVIDQAINDIAKGEPTILDLTPNTTGYSYTIVAEGLVRRDQIQAVWWRASSASYDKPIELRHWKVEQDGQEITLWIDYVLSDDALLWIEYLAGPGGLTSPGSRTLLPPSYVRAAAIVRLLENMLMQQDEAGTQRIGTLLRDARDRLQQEVGQLQRLPAKAKTTHWKTRSRPFVEPDFSPIGD